MTMHDGSRIVLRKLDEAFDPTDRAAAQARVQERLGSGEYLTGLLYVGTEGGPEGGRREFHQVNRTPEEPLNSLPYEALSPGANGLAKLLSRYR